MVAELTMNKVAIAALLVTLLAAASAVSYYPMMGMGGYGMGMGGYGMGMGGYGMGGFGFGGKYGMMGMMGKYYG